MRFWKCYMFWKALCFSIWFFRISTLLMWILGDNQSESNHKGCEIDHFCSTLTASRIIKIASVSKVIGVLWSYDVIFEVLGFGTLLMWIFLACQARTKLEILKMTNFGDFGQIDGFRCALLSTNDSIPHRKHASGFPRDCLNTLEHLEHAYGWYWGDRYCVWYQGVWGGLNQLFKFQFSKTKWIHIIPH